MTGVIEWIPSLLFVLLFAFLIVEGRGCENYYKIYIGILGFMILLFIVSEIFFVTNFTLFSVPFAIMLHFSLFALVIGKMSGGFCRKLKRCAALPSLPFIVFTPYLIATGFSVNAPLLFLFFFASFLAAYVVMVRHGLRVAVQRKRLFLAAFLPVVGSLIYIFVHVRRGDSGVQGDV